MVRKGWAVELDGVVISGSDDPGDGCLIEPPEGLGNPPIRTEDVTFPQRDGVRHYADWYEPRIVTLQATVCGGDGCGKACPGAREHVRNILRAWRRRCDDVELKVWTDCSDSVPCEDESPGDTNEVWPLDGAPGQAVTTGNSNLDLVNPGGGTITYLAGGGARFTSTPAGSFTIGRGLTETSDTVMSFLGVFSIPAAPSSDLAFWNLRRTGSEVPAVRIRVNPSREVTLSDTANATIGTGPIGIAAPGAIYQLTMVVDSATGSITARLYTSNGSFLGGQSSTTANLSGLPLTGFDIGIISSNPATSVDMHHVEIAVGSTTEITPTGVNAPGPDRSLVGPYGIVGRPRLAVVQWLRGRSGCARLTLRFDARDHRMFVLDCDGGTGEVCVEAHPNVETRGRTYPRCYHGLGMCFDCDTGRESGDALAEVQGVECASPQICFNGQLNNPILRNLTTGDQVGLMVQIRADDPPICIDTETGTATQGGAGRTSLITGNPRMRLVPGVNILRLISTESTDDGFAEICFRPFTVSA